MLDSNRNQDRWVWKKIQINNIRYSQKYISIFFKDPKNGYITDLIAELNKSIKSLHKDYTFYNYENKEDDPIFRILKESSISVINYKNKLWTISNRRFFCIKYVLLNTLNILNIPKIWVKYFESPNDYINGNIFIENYKHMIKNISKGGLDIRVNFK